MANPRLESGQMQVRSVGGVPMAQVGLQQVDNIGYRAQAQTAQTLSQVLDRMGSQLFEEAGRQVQQRALTDVVNNPISDEQLQAAKQGDVSMLKLGGGVNMYDIAVRKARSFELAGRFEMEAKNEAVKIMADIEAGNMDSTQAAQKLNVLTAGYGKSLSSVDPDAALKFNASMGVYGSTIVAKAYELEVKKRKQQQAIMLEGSLANDMKLIPAVLEQGVYTNANGETRSAVEFLDVYRKNLSDRAFAAGGLETAQHYLGKFDKEVQQQKINVLSKHFTGESELLDPEAQLKRLRAGDAGKMSHILQDMIATDFDSIAKVEANIMATASHRHQMKQQKDAEIKKAGESQAIGLLTQIYALPEGDQRRKALTGQLTTVARNAPGSVPFGVMKDLLDTTNNGNPQVEFNVRNGIYNGSITTSEQVWSHVGKGLSGKQAVSALTLLNAEDRRDSQELDRGLSRLAGIPTMPGQVTVIDPKGVEFQRLQGLRSQALQVQSEAVSKGEVITPREVLSRIEQGLEKTRQSEGAKAARAQLEIYEKKEWVNGKITRDGLSALEKKAGTDRNKLNELKRIRSLLDQAEGNQQ